MSGRRLAVVTGGGCGRATARRLDAGWLASVAYDQYPGCPGGKR